MYIFCITKVVFEKNIRGMGKALSCWKDQISSFWTSIVAISKVRSTPDNS